MEETAEETLSFFNEKPSDLIKEHRQVYLLVNGIARRVRQLQTGDRALALPANGVRDPFYIAQEEFMQDKLEIVPRTTHGFETFYEEDTTPDLDILLGMNDDTDAFDADDDDDE